MNDSRMVLNMIIIYFVRCIKRDKISNPKETFWQITCIQLLIWHMLYFLFNFKMSSGMHFEMLILATQTYYTCIEKKFKVHLHSPWRALIKKSRNFPHFLRRKYTSFLPPKPPNPPTPPAHFHPLQSEWLINWRGGNWYKCLFLKFLTLIHMLEGKGKVPLYLHIKYILSW